MKKKLKGLQHLITTTVAKSKSQNVNMTQDDYLFMQHIPNMSLFCAEGIYSSYKIIFQE